MSSGFVAPMCHSLYDQPVILRWIQMSGSSKLLRFTRLSGKLDSARNLCSITFASVPRKDSCSTYSMTLIGRRTSDFITE